jgi:hypothetical protein
VQKSANYLVAVSQSLLVVHLNAEQINCKCLCGADGFEELVDSMHEAGDLHLVRKFVNFHCQLGVLKISLLSVQEPAEKITKLSCHKWDSNYNTSWRIQKPQR